jgi:hypothetical protein
MKLSLQVVATIALVAASRVADADVIPVGSGPASARTRVPVQSDPLIAGVTINAGHESLAAQLLKAAKPECTSDLDCSLNGACVERICLCRTAWTGWWAAHEDRRWPAQLPRHYSS